MSSVKRAYCAGTGRLAVNSLRILSANRSLPACCLFHLCSHQNEANIVQKCHILKIHSNHHIPLSNCCYFDLLSSWRPFHMLNDTCNCSDPLLTDALETTARRAAFTDLARVTIKQFWVYEESRCSELSHLSHEELSSRCIRCVEDFALQQRLEGAPNVAQTRCVLQGVNKGLTERIYRKEKGRRDDRESQCKSNQNSHPGSWDREEKENRAAGYDPNINRQTWYILNMSLKFMWLP